MSSNSFKEKLNRPKKDSNKIYRSIVELIPNNWIQILKNKTSQESLLKVFHFNDRGIRKIKNFQKVSTKISTILFRIITMIIIGHSNSFHGRTTFKKIQS